MLLATLSSMSLAVAGCKEDAAGARGATAAVEVGTITATPQDLPIVTELPGRVAPTQTAEVRPRVDGIIEQRVFTQGAAVARGDVLFHIDPTTYQVAVEAAQAGVAHAEAALTEARTNEDRLRALANRNVSSQSQLDAAVAAELQARADLAAAQAELHAAQVSLGWTEVKAPISGVIGRAQVTEGALVQAGGSDVLATIQSLDPIYADIQQPVSELLRLRGEMQSGALTQVDPDSVQAHLHLDDGSVYPAAGKLLFSEVTVERTSGQVTIRAEFPNPDRTLLPGMYVRVSIDQALKKGAIAVPQQAIQRDASGATLLYVVGAEGTVALKPVKLGRPVGNRMIVEDGLAAGDVVVVDGLQKIGPGTKVTPVAWTAPSAAQAGAD